MKRIAIIENEYIRDTQVFSEDPATIASDPDWMDKFVDVKYPSQYIGIYEGIDDDEIRQKAADNFGVHAGIISLESFEHEKGSEIIDVYVCPVCENEKHPAGAKYCAICGNEIDQDNQSEINTFEFERFKTHIGHKIKVVVYGKKNVTIECVDCYEVLYSVDISNPLQKTVELDETTVINKVFKKGSDIPLKPVQLAKEAGFNITPADFPSRISGSGHCDCPNGGEFELYPKSHRAVKSSGGKRYMKCRICGGISHL